MLTDTTIAVQFLNAMAAMALFAVIYGTVVRRLPDNRLRPIALGVLFGTSSLLALTQRMELAPGVLIDMRHLPIAFAGAFAGPAAMLVTLAMSACARIAIGGAGLAGGLISMAMAGLAGVLWARVFLDRIGRPPAQLLALGTMASLNLTGAFALPWALAVSFFQLFAAPMMIMNILGTLVVGGAIYRERALAMAERTLRHTASRDPLTGVLNRLGFYTLAAAAKSRAGPDAPSAVLLLDLDHFKGVNDRHGHGAGDAVLVETARRLKSELRGDDTLGRFGGEEFVVFVPSIPPERAILLASRLRRAIGERPFAVEDESLRVTVSVGAWAFDQATDLDQAIQRADERLYEAKARGRDRISFGSTDMFPGPEAACEPRVGTDRDPEAPSRAEGARTRSVRAA